MTEDAGVRVRSWPHLGALVCWVRDVGRFASSRPALLVGSTLSVAALVPPAVLLPSLLPIGSGIVRAWFYFCSMLLGASPFLVCGALATAVVGSARARGSALALFAIFFPGCDCSMNACAPSLRAARPGLAAFALIWGSCCNPLALYATASILGPRMMWCRALSGAIAASLAALACSRLPAPRPSHPCGDADGFAQTFARSAGSGIASFAVAAGTSALCASFLAGAPLGGGILGAALAGALLSPCSSADALLARVLFAAPASQLAFVIAAQCLDLRQISLVLRCFGSAHALRAAGAAMAGIAVGCLLASR